MTNSRVPPQRSVEWAQERCAGCTHRRSNHNIGMRAGALGHVECGVCTGCVGFAEPATTETLPPAPTDTTVGDVLGPRASDPRPDTLPVAAAETAAAEPGDAWLAARRERGQTGPDPAAAPRDAPPVDVHVTVLTAGEYGSWDAYLCPRCGQRRFETFVCCLGPARPVLVTITFRETP